jgi:hypothetical protein
MDTFTQLAGSLREATSQHAGPPPPPRKRQEKVRHEVGEIIGNFQMVAPCICNTRLCRYRCRTCACESLLAPHRVRDGVARCYHCLRASALA